MITRSITRPITRSISNGLTKSSIGSPVPLSGLVQRWDGTGYRSSQLNGVFVLDSREPYGDYREPLPASCLNFSGTAFLTRTKMFTSAPSAMTFAAWIKPSSTTGTIAMEGTSTGDDVAFKLSMVSGFLTVTVSQDGNIVSGSERIEAYSAGITNNTWQHVACTFDGAAAAGSQVKIFINGESKTLSYNYGEATDLNTLHVTTTAGFRVGRTGSGTQNFAGRMFDLRVYDAAKTETEIAAIANNIVAKSAPDTTDILHGFWLNQRAGTDAYDWTGNAISTAHSGTVTHVADSPGNGWNPSNTFGYYSISSTTEAPRNELDPTKSVVFGLALTYAGQCPYPIVPIVPTLTLDDAEYVATGTNLGLIDSGVMGAFSIVARVKMPSSGVMRIVGSGMSVLFTRNASDNLLGGIYRTTTNRIAKTTTATLANSEWADVAMTFDGGGTESGITLYINGVAQATSSSSQGSLDDAVPESSLFIGRWNDTFYNDSDSEYGFMKIYGSELTAAQVLAESTSDSVATLLHYICEESSGTTLYDVSGNANHGTITAAAAWANTTAAKRNHNVDYGGRMDGSVYVGGLTDGSSAANGSSITLPAGTVSRNCEPDYDYWSAAELTALGMGTAFAYDDNVQTTSPADTKFRRTSANDAIDRIHNYHTVMTGAELASIVSYTATVALVGLASLFISSVDTRLASASVASTSKPRWNPRVQDPLSFTSNGEWWCKSFAIHCKSVWNDRGVQNEIDKTFRHPGTLILPTVVVGAAHQGLQTGDFCKFVDGNGNIITREVIDHANHPSYSGPLWYYADIRLSLLDSAVTGITPAWLLPDDWEDYLPNGGSPYIPGIRSNQSDSWSVFDVSLLYQDYSEDVGPITLKQTPTDSKRLEFHTTALGGDSGHPWFLVGTDAPIFLGHNTSDARSPCYLVNAEESFINWVSNKCQTWTGARPKRLPMYKYEPIS